MTQTEIILQNLWASYATRHYKSSPYGSLGWVLAYLYVYCGFNVMENATVGQNEVRLHGKKIADFVMDEEKQLPVFSFMPDFNLADMAIEKQKLTIANIETFREKENQYR